jgi:8-oxo-dGTP pyrophosphatase MutT (NUDIX family)
VGTANKNWIVSSDSRRIAGIALQLTGGVNDRKFLLVRGVDGTSKGKWGFPKGGVHDNETPEQGAYREMFEETGVILSTTSRIVNSTEKCGNIFTYVTYTLPYFVCLKLSYRKKKLTIMVYSLLVKQVN